MIVRICPLCDSEMKKAHYCDTCHSFVWRPQMLDVHYNTQSRGLGEVDCSYGEEHDHYDHKRHIEQEHKANEEYWQARKRQQQEFEEGRHGKKKAAAGRRPSAAGDHAEVFGTPEKKKKSSGGGIPGCLTWLFVIFILMRIVAGMGGCAGVITGLEDRLGTVIEQIEGED